MKMSQLEVDALLELAEQEPATVEDLAGAVDKLKAIHAAKRRLALMGRDVVADALRRRNESRASA